MKGIKATLFFFFLMGIGHALMMVITEWMKDMALKKALCFGLLLSLRFQESFSFLLPSLIRLILGKV